MPRHDRTLAIAAAPLLAMGASGLAQTGPITVSFDEPARDRWNYPFSATPGTRVAASVFGAVGVPGFDDRDAQFVVGFDTAADIPTGLGADAYRVVSARVQLVILNRDTFAYDPTIDPIATYLPDGDPDRAEDADAGRPIEIFATAYRNGFSIATWEETTDFTTDPTFPPPEGSRTAFAAVYGADGAATDVSNQVADRLDAEPLAVGLTDDAAPGELVPAEAFFAFDIDTCGVGAARFFSESLDAGRLNFTITGLHDATMGTTDPTFPVFITRENALAAPLGYAPRLELTVIAVDDADLNGDGELTIFDFLDFQNAFDAGDPLADFDGDCALTLFDFLAFQNAFDAG
ncbi:MAG: GC-type dockerin domain-anchored protein [Planctomycetota bacterium]